VVRHYNEGFTKRESLSDQIYPLGLSDKEQADLVAFLKTLSSNDTPTTIPRLPAYDQTVEGSVSGISSAAGPRGPQHTCEDRLQYAVLALAALRQVRTMSRVI